MVYLDITHLNVDYFYNSSGTSLGPIQADLAAESMADNMNKTVSTSVTEIAAALAEEDTTPADEKSLREAQENGEYPGTGGFLPYGFSGVIAGVGVSPPSKETGALKFVSRGEVKPRHFFCPQ